MIPVVLAVLTSALVLVTVVQIAAIIQPRPRRRTHNRRTDS